MRRSSSATTAPSLELAPNIAIVTKRAPLNNGVRPEADLRRGEGQVAV
jgi:hypothetical protein